MNKRSNSILAAICLSGCLVSSFSPSVAQAQGRARVGRNAKIDVTQDVRRAESTSNTFRAAYERALSDKEFANSPTNQALKGRVQSLDESLERLRSDIGGLKNRHEIRQRIVQVFQLARPVDRALNNKRRIRVDLRPQWQSLRSALNALGADAGAGRI